MTASREAHLDLTGFLRPGDRILVESGAGEPVTLTRLLVDQRHSIPPVDVLLGFTIAPTITAEHTPPMHVTVLGGYGANAQLTAHGADVLPCHASQIPDLIERGIIHIDVLFVQCRPEDGDGLHNLGVTSDLPLVAARKARVVVAEVNDQMPTTSGDTGLPSELITVKVPTSRPLPELSSPPVGHTEEAIAALVADHIPDRSVLQVGIGRLPQATAASLRGHGDLGVHSGFLGDWTLELADSGALTNAFKPIDRGVTVGGMVMGSQRLYEWAHQNPSLSMRDSRYTHGSETLAKLDTLVTINSAIEIDLTGQVSAETIGGRYLGAVGGGSDYIRAGASATEGHSFLVLTSTAKEGAKSRIVDHLPDGVVTTPRSDVDIVVTEHGIAELRGQSLAERRRRLLAIADPAFRDELEMRTRDR